MIQWWQILLLTLYSAYQICDELTIVSSAGSPCIRWFHYWFSHGRFDQLVCFIGGSSYSYCEGWGTFGGASRMDATSGAGSCDNFLSFTRYRKQICDHWQLTRKRRTKTSIPSDR